MGVDEKSQWTRRAAERRGDVVSLHRRSQENKTHPRIVDNLVPKRRLDRILSSKEEKDKGDTGGILESPLSQDPQTIGRWSLVPSLLDSSLLYLDVHQPFLRPIRRTRALASP